MLSCTRWSGVRRFSGVIALAETSRLTVPGGSAGLMIAGSRKGGPRGGEGDVGGTTAARISLVPGASVVAGAGVVAGAVVVGPAEGVGAKRISMTTSRGGGHSPRTQSTGDVRWYENVHAPPRRFAGVSPKRRLWWGHRDPAVVDVPGWYAHRRSWPYLHHGAPHHLPHCCRRCSGQWRPGATGFGCHDWKAH